MLTFTPEVCNQIELHKSLSELNTILYNNNEQLNKSLKTIYPKADRFDIVNKCNVISRELIPYIYTNFHGKKVVVTDKWGKNELEGVIEHLPTRMYDNNGTQRETSNDVSFRDGIALWVNTGDRYTTHLYNSSDITLVEELVVADI